MRTKPVGRKGDFSYDYQLGATRLNACGQAVSITSERLAWFGAPQHEIEVNNGICAFHTSTEVYMSILPNV